MSNYSELKKLAEAATPQDFDSAEEKVENGYIECPHCGGSGEVELEADYCNYDNVAIGVQFYGIGHEFGAAEAYYRAARPTAVLALIADRDALAAQRDEGLAREERLRMQLVACGVVAMSNTKETADKQRKMHPGYKSSSCDEVSNAVDREMALRLRLAEAEKLLLDVVGLDPHGEFMGWELDGRIDAFLARPGCADGEKALCKGDTALGTACGSCERCKAGS
jgi:hypothetical protein